jgi:hypothetical protein
VLNGRVVLDTTSLSTYQKGSATPSTASPLPASTRWARFEWDAVDAWCEEDEQVFVHPGTPYTRVDALGSARQLLPIAGLVAFYNEKVDIVLDGQRLARPAARFS